MFTTKKLVSCTRVRKVISLRSNLQSIANCGAYCNIYSNNFPCYTNNSKINTREITANMTTVDEHNIGHVPTKTTAKSTQENCKHDHSWWAQHPWDMFSHQQRQINARKVRTDMNTIGRRNMGHVFTSPMLKSTQENYVQT